MTRKRGRVGSAPWTVWALVASVLLAPASALASPQPDPERTLGVPTGWHWYHDRTAKQLRDAADKHGDRIVDVEVVGDRYTAAMVSNTGAFERQTTGNWFHDKTRGEVVEATKGEGWRLIDLEAGESGSELQFAGVRVPNEGDSRKGWWWNYDLKPKGVTKDINQHGIRLVDLEAYERDGKRRYAYVGIKNEGVDASAWWWYFGLSAKNVNKKLEKHDARLIDVERLSNGKLAVVMVASDGTYWRWGHGVSQSRMTELYAMHGVRIVDVEQWKTDKGRRYSFVAVNAVGGETARLRGLLDNTFDQPATFGSRISRGAYVKQLDGPVVAGLAEEIRFQPYSVLKLLPYTLAIDHVDSGAPGVGGGSPTTLDSQISWTEAVDDDPETKLNEPRDQGCLKPDAEGTKGRSASLRDALQTMMWESHSRTLDAVMAHFDTKPRKKTDYLQEKITDFVDGIGMVKTEMHQGCPDPDGDSPWLRNRSTLTDLGTLYEKVATGQVWSNASSVQAFEDLMINLTPTGYSADYGGLYSNFSPITFRPAGPAYLPGFVQTIAEEEAGPAKYTIVDDFIADVRYRGKGGNADVYLGDGDWESGWADQVWAELPFADGAYNRSYALGWWVNRARYDQDCRPTSLACAAIWDEEAADRDTLARELWREPIRQALETWTVPSENQPPVPTITSPAAGSSHNNQSTVALRGSATDPEGDPITYSWAAIFDGASHPLGANQNIDWVPRDTLGPRSAGVYNVVLRFQASDGSAARFKEVTIGVVYPPS